MKIICVEEHAMDAAIAKAVQPAQALEAGYMKDWGSRVEDTVTLHDRPRQVPGKLAFTLAPDLGQGRLDAMDEHGIDMQVLSYSNALQLAEASAAPAMARAANDRLAAAVEAHPNRFRAFAILPWQAPAEAVAELKRTVSEHGFVGALIQGRPGPTFLDDPLYAPVLSALDELQVPLSIHPGFPLQQVREPYYASLDREISARFSLFAWGWHNEAGIQVLRLMLAGAFEAYPKLQIISGHWGEMVPFFLQRLDDTIPQSVTGFDRTLTDVYRQHVYVNPSGMLYTPHFEFIHEVLGADRILYSVDYPYVTLDGSRRFLETLDISQQERELIAHRNAEALFRL